MNSQLVMTQFVEEFRLRLFEVRLGMGDAR